ncbi:hypothetical protein K469DRAFT_17980 [Zopfia rhizophila CBS 207.26]|uniref:Uncharacterized protein n=1 Tax=Zopfia rhizophila CBS 207.26 TaxID=1314779 RepID=A0A6A6EW13_9PEZI|nr:hypothetical protein K469DRAFT_17980 [Zopfia rhizophila CBS 207.26]
MLAIVGEKTSDGIFLDKFGWDPDIHILYNKRRFIQFQAAEWIKRLDWCCLLMVPWCTILQCNGRSLFASLLLVYPLSLIFGPILDISSYARKADPANR